MTKNKHNTRPRVLELKRETIVQLSLDTLKQVVGGSNSLHPSQCVGDRCV